MYLNKASLQEACLKPSRSLVWHNPGRKGLGEKGLRRERFNARREGSMEMAGILLR
jgi:hypothetical protein